MKDQILFGTYRICGSMGNGPSSCVYLVRHIMLKQFRAIKCTPKSISGSDPSVFQQSHEPLILESVRHACIPVLYDYCEDADYCYLVEEYIPGDTLDDYLREHKKMSYLLFCRMASALADTALCLYASEYHYIYTEWKPEHIRIMGDSIHLLDYSGGSCTTGQKRGNAESKPCQKRPDVKGLAKLLLFAEPYVDRCKSEIKSLLKLCAEESGENGITMEQLKNYFDREIDSFKAATDTQTDTSCKKTAVLGATNSVGVTHFAISLSVYLRFRGIDAVYAGKPYILEQIAEYHPHSVKTGDTVISGGFRGVVFETDTHDPITIEDMGVFTDWSIGLENCDDVFVILGSNPWEVTESLRTFERLRYKDGIHFLVSYGNARMARWYTGKLHRSVGCFPLDADPFSCDEKKTKFFEALL
ncbi:MAG: protein kinase [Lachnospiraceae bacterium]|nr:protein kinase [Lachnospiraceae bacterium]